MGRIRGALLARVAPRAMPALDQVGLLLGLVLATSAYARLYAAHPWLPAAARLDQGWWTWWDQGRYLDAALAWAAGDLDPSRHFYLPGYPLLAAPFVHLTPAQPFWWPDLACLLAAMMLFALLAARLASRIPPGCGATTTTTTSSGSCRCSACMPRCCWPALLGSARRGRVALVAGIAAALLFCWRVELAPRPDETGAAVLDEHTLRIPGFSGRVDDVVLAGASGPVEAIYFGKHTLSVADRGFEHLTDFKVFPRPGGLMLMPLRPMPAGEVIITFGPGVHLDPAMLPRQERQRIVLSLPFTRAPSPPPP